MSEKNGSIKMYCAQCTYLLKSRIDLTLSNELLDLQLLYMSVNNMGRRCYST